jgi:hypothetical protein
MKSTIFLASFAFLALFSVASCELISHEAQAEPNKTLAQSEISTERLSKTLKTTNEILVMNNSKWQDALSQKLAADAVALKTLSDINAEITNLREGIFIDPTKNNAPIFAEWAKKQAQLVGKLTAALEKLRDCSTRELQKLNINSNMFDIYAEPLMSQADFSALTIDEQRAYVHILRQDLLNLHNLLLNMLLEPIGKLDIKYDKFDVVANTPKPYIMLGEEYETEISVGVYSSQARFSIAVDGQPIPIIGGKGTYKTRPTKAGEQKYEATISVKNPMTGEVETVTKQFRYEVGTADNGGSKANTGNSPVVISADKMNILYIGVDNPISIFSPDMNDKDFKIKGSEGLTVERQNDNYYIARATKIGEATITMSADSKNTAPKVFRYRVKRIPDPIAKINNKTGGIMSSAEFMATAGLVAVLENFDFDAKCEIQSYTLIHTPKGGSPSNYVGTGARFIPPVSNAIKAAASGDTYSFMDIKARCPGDATGRAINSIAIMIK